MDPRRLPLVRSLPVVGNAPAPLVLEIDLSHGISTHRPSDPISALRQRSTPSLPAIVDGLRLAADDRRVAGLLLLGCADLAPAHADELGEAIEQLDHAGTHTYAFAESYGEMFGGTVPYGLAARCREIWMQPSGQVAATGVAAQITLLRGVLEKLDLEPQFVQRKEYKTAADQFAAREISEANREMTARLVASTDASILALVARRRGIDEAELREIVDRAPLQAAEALEARLIDRLGYRDELYDALRERHGSDLELRFAHRYADRRHKEQMASPSAQVAKRRSRRIAVVPVDGAIVSGRSRQTAFGRSAGSDTVVAALRGARERDDVHAVLLAIDSPGGSYVASDAIRRELLALREAKIPVAASMGALAASGGYFAAMGADSVVAQPTTLTGSIGVLAGKVVTTALADRLGLVHELVAEGDNAAMFSSLQPFSDQQRARLDRWLDDVYADFTGKAAADRGMEREQLEPLARGRVWTGADACERGLVDRLGGRETAIAELCRRLGRRREQVELVSWPPLSWVERLKPAESTHAPAAARLSAVPAGGLEDALVHLAARAGTPVPGVLALPWSLRIA